MSGEKVCGVKAVWCEQVSSRKRCLAQEAVPRAKGVWCKRCFGVKVVWCKRCQV